MKRYFLLALVLGASASAGFAATGTFGYGIELTATGSSATNSGQKTLYALDQNGGIALIPTGSTATLSTAWTSASSDANPVFNLGSFDPTVGDTLILNGGSILTYQNSGDEVSPGSQYLNYGTNAGTTGTGNFQPGINLTLDSTTATPTPGDERFAKENSGVNLLTGLSPGHYVLDTYGYASNNYESNGGANFAASFTVLSPTAAPEPGTWAMIFAGAALLIGFQRFRLRL